MSMSSFSRSHTQSLSFTFFYLICLLILHSSPSSRSLPPSLTLSMVYSVLQIRRAKVAGVDTNDETEQGDEISTKDCGLPGNHAPPSTRQRPAFEGLISSPATWLESSSLPPTPPHPTLARGPNLMSKKTSNSLAPH